MVSSIAETFTLPQARALRAQKRLHKLQPKAREDYFYWGPPINYPHDATRVLAKGKCVETTRNVTRRRVPLLLDKHANLPRSEGESVEEGNKQREVETEEAEGSIESGGGGGEPIAVRRDHSHMRSGGGGGIQGWTAIQVRHRHQRLV